MDTMSTVKQGDQPLRSWTTSLAVRLKSRQTQFSTFSTTQELELYELPESSQIFTTDAYSMSSEASSITSPLEPEALSAPRTEETLVEEAGSHRVLGHVRPCWAHETRSAKRFLQFGCTVWLKFYGNSMFATIMSTAAMELEPSKFFGSQWFAMAMGIAYTALHVCLTKSDMGFGVSRLLERCRQHKHVMTQRELDKKRRFEQELLRARIGMFSMVQCVGIHMAFSLALAAMYHVVTTGSQASSIQLLGTFIGYGVHALIQSGLVEIKSASHIRFLEVVSVIPYAVHLCAVANETDLGMFLATEKITTGSMVLLSVIFIDLKMTLPVYISGAVVLTYKQFQLIGFSNVKPMFFASTLASHASACGLVSFIVLAIQSQIAGKLDSQDVSSLLLASRRVLRGVCDGDLVLDSRNHSIVDDASSLERLLKTPKNLADTSFLDLFLDPEGRQNFLQFLQSETAPRESDCIPPCLRIALQGAEGPVSTDIFCTSLAAAGQDYFLLALRADPDQFLAPPDVLAAPPARPPVPDPQTMRPAEPSQGTASSIEVPEALKELVQATLLVSKESSGMDIEEVSLSFLRHPRSRNFMRINDWPRMEDFFKRARSPPVKDEAIPGFPSPLLLRIPGSRPRAYLLARSTSVSVAEEEEEESGKPSHFYLNLGFFDVQQLRRRNEQDLESIHEDHEEGNNIGGGWNVPCFTHNWRSQYSSTCRLLKRQSDPIGFPLHPQGYQTRHHIWAKNMWVWKQVRV